MSFDAQCTFKRHDLDSSCDFDFPVNMIGTDIRSFIQNVPKMITGLSASITNHESI